MEGSTEDLSGTVRRTEATLAAGLECRICSGNDGPGLRVGLAAAPAAERTGGRERVSVADMFYREEQRRLTRERWAACG